MFSQERMSEIERSIIRLGYKLSRYGLYSAIEVFDKKVFEPQTVVYVTGDLTTKQVFLDYIENHHHIRKAIGYHEKFLVFDNLGQFYVMPNPGRFFTKHKRYLPVIRKYNRSMRRANKTVGDEEEFYQVFLRLLIRFEADIKQLNKE